MDNLQKRNTLSPWQLGIILLMTGVGSDIITSSNKLFVSVGQLAWLVPLVAGGAYFGATFLMIKLGELFPGESFSTYAQHIWGRRVAILIIWLFIAIMMVELSVRIQIFSREIIFFMFDRTPPEVIMLTLLGVSAYCALQDLGTVLSVVQIFFFTALPMLMSIILLGFINFQFINIYPLWPIDIAGLAKGSLGSWVFYFGYESVLWLLPWVYRGKNSVIKAIGTTFVLKGLLMTVAMLMTLGVHTLEGVKGTPYPTAVGIRGVELPGTFIERIDNYMFLAWIPLAFTTCAIQLFVLANAATEVHRYKDHRPFVLLFVPVLFLGGMGLHDLSVFTLVADYVHWFGLAFSFMVIPATYVVARWKKRRPGVATP